MSRISRREWTMTVTHDYPGPVHRLGAAMPVTAVTLDDLLVTPEQARVIWDDPRRHVREMRTVLRKGEAGLVRLCGIALTLDEAKAIAAGDDPLGVLLAPARLEIRMLSRQEMLADDLPL